MQIERTESVEIGFIETLELLTRGPGEGVTICVRGLTVTFTSAEWNRLLSFAANGYRSSLAGKEPWRK